jgi:hypothetical protein
MASRGYIGATPADTPFDTSPFIEMLRGAISGLVQSQAADTDHDITLSVGGALDDTHSAWMKLSSTLTKQIDAAWAEGDAAGGLDSGTVANSTWYYIWLIKNLSSGTVDALFSTSSSSPTMPSGYSLKRLVGAVLTDGSANIYGFTAYEQAGGGLLNVWDVVKLDSTTPVNITPANVTLSVPPLSGVFATFNAYIHRTTTATAVAFRSPDATDEDPTVGSGTANAGQNSSAASGISQDSVRMPTVNGQIRTDASATVTTTAIGTTMWEWSRR